MSYKIILSDVFRKEAKRLAKKYPSLIYNKGDKDTISDKEIKELLKNYL